MALKLAAFLSKPTDIASLVFLRVGFGLLMFWEINRYFWNDWIEELYVSCLSRKPLEKETAAFTAILEENKENTTQVLEDIFWSLLNSREFIFNH